MCASIPAILASGSQDAPAVLSLGQSPLTYGALLAVIERTVRSLNGAGVGRGDRVAVVLPNGPEMAVCFLATAAGAVCAPLNPAYRAAEFAFYLKDLKAKALILAAGVDSPVREVAAALEIQILELTPEAGGPAGAFTIAGAGPPAAAPVYSAPGDIALVLHTSGTTSRPKIVPLTHRNLTASAKHIARTLALRPVDRCLNIMPLFHIHGLIGATLSSIAAGASIVCTPGFEAPRVLEWFTRFQPTWYTAVPTMHQAILERVAANPAALGKFRPRLIRSSSSSLAPQVMAELEKVFQAPVIESYGMTEAAHQMASNPLPPGSRKPGSVGLAAGPEVAVMNGNGRVLAPGETGEVVIRGPNVTLGYENNPEANQAAFSDGWFRTGDQGYLDDDGYLYLTGRLKEIINRGGEKISPREIDEVLLDHPAVAQSVAFALPDERLGEEVAAAVVLRSEQAATETGLREFAAGRLADFKIPRRIVILDEIPKGPTGKVQRIGLATKLGLDQTTAEPAPVAGFRPPTSELEQTICEIWRELLGLERVGLDDNFFNRGGDSVLATMFVSRLRAATGRTLPLIKLFDHSTPAGVIGVLEAGDIDGQ